MRSRTKSSGLTSWYIEACEKVNTRHGSPGWPNYGVRFATIQLMPFDRLVAIVLGVGPW